MIKHVPNIVKAQDNKKLEQLRRFLEGKNSLAFRDLSQQCVEQVMKSIVQAKPKSNDLDYYDWGYRQGLLEAHRLYRALLDHVLNELENRSTDEVDEGETTE